MKRFIRQIILFLALPAGVLACLVGMGKPPPVLFGEEIDTVIVGDSHTRCAVNDTLLPGYANLSRGSEIYIFTHAKLRYLLAERPTIKRIYLAFSYHNLSSYTDNFTHGTDAKRQIRLHARLMSASELTHIVLQNRDMALSLIRGMLPARIASRHFDPGLHLAGEYKPFDTDKPLNEASIERRINSQYYLRGKLYPFSTFNIQELQHIVDLCRARRVNLYLFNTPLHRSYREKIPAEYMAAYDELVAKLGVPIIDISQMELPENGYLPDGDHVNRIGDKYIAEYLAKLPRAGK